MSACPSEEQLAVYASDGGDPPQREAIRVHVETCSACRALLDDVRSGEPMLGDIRRVMDAEAAAATVAPAPGVAVTVDWSLDAGRRAGQSATSQGIEGYEIVGELGRGGMGAVYLATQLSTKRKVALKVLLEGPFASEVSKRRFEREVELAAQLQHPGIVTILESGVASGRYYFAMQYVAGQRLDTWLARRPFSVRERLTLFARICDAVNYAHVHGVMHRDLKPSNILVDADGTPHILDFGLAKISDGSQEDLHERSLLSVTGQIMGTLPYMSPEQASGHSQGVDIRTDVYSLGVILYEVLTGRYPYTVAGPVVEVLRNIAEAAPARPSTIRREIDDEVETIVLKTLAKEKDRRYQSAGNLGDDIHRYLAGRPIEAKRDSTGYVLRKMLHRHRAPVAAFLLFAALVSASAASWWRQRVRLERAAAADLMSLFVSEPAKAAERVDAADGAIRSRVSELAERYVASPAYTERVAGARSGPWLVPEAFWRSVDGGPLWRNGEWLELAEATWDSPARLVPSLCAKATEGSERERYAACCLLGWLAGKNESLAELCARAAETDTTPGAAMAAWWAAQRLGREPRMVSRACVFVDELTGSIFVQVPGCEAFRRGSDRSDPDRLDDENSPAQGVPIPAFHLAATETTLAAFAPFFRDAANAGVFGPNARQGIEEKIQAAGDRSARVAVEWVSLKAARAYCAWLNERAATASPRRRYRLPNENEWEYACRAGNAGRFCFGEDANYARFFAKCNGVVTPVHVVAERMPNAFGLFDMHGGVWERCDSPYTGPGVAAGNPPLYAQRGGAYYSPAVRCRSAQRNYSDETSESQYTGLRLVMEIIHE